MIRNVKKILLLSLFSASMVLAQYNSDFNITGAGARAEGFGGAFIGLADDATAVVWNPSGLTQLERPEASIVTRYISDKVALKNDINQQFNSEESTGRFSLNFASVAMPLSKSDQKIVGAIAIQKQLDFSEKSKSFEYDNFGNVVEQVVDGTGGVNTITPAIALKLNPMIAVGVSVNIWTGSIENKSSTENVGIGKDRLDYSADYSGLNFVLGSLIDFEQMRNGFPLKVGATIRTPFELTSEGKIEYNDQLSSTPGQYTFDVKQTIKMPVMIGLGASYRVGENLTFAFDYELRNYAQKNITTDLTLTGVGTTSVVEPVSESGKNLSEIRFGAEYLIVGDKGVIPLRAGFKTVPTVLSDVNVQYDAALGEIVFTPTGNQVTGTGIAFGSGFITDSFAIDVTFGAQAYSQKIGNNAQFDFSVGTLSSSVIIYF